MQMYVPPFLPTTPTSAHAFTNTPATIGQMGSPKPTWPTTPSPKNVAWRSNVRSMNWSGTTKSVGLCSSFRLPTALTLRILVTPSFFIA